MKSYKLNKNGLLPRYMKWVWGFGPEDFTNMCPYTWLSICTVILFPVAILIVLITKIVLIRLNYKLRAKSKDKENTDLMVQRIVSDKAYVSDIEYATKAYIDRYIKRKYSDTYHYFIGRLYWELKEKYEGDDTFTYSLDLGDVIIWMGVHDKDNVFRTKLMLAVAQYNKKKLTPGKLVKYAKPTAVVLSSGLLIVASIYLIMLLSLVNWTWDMLVIFLVIIGSLTMLALIVVGVVYLGEKLWPPLSSILDKIGDTLLWLWRPIGRNIIKLFTFIDKTYENNCPGIEWED